MFWKGGLTEVQGVFTILFSEFALPRSGTVSVSQSVDTRSDVEVDGSQLHLICVYVKLEGGGVGSLPQQADAAQCIGSTSTQH